MEKYKLIQSKTALSKNKQPSKWFGVHYKVNPYRGCSHNCIYCDARSECYQLEDFNCIEVKENLGEIIRKELRTKRNKGTIGTGGMTDPYMPIERKFRITRSLLEAIDFYHYPVLLFTKSKLILDDLELLKSINSKSKCSVAITLTTIYDEVARVTEPGASTVTERLETIRTLSENGIYVGVTMMPILPFINDKPDDIKKLVQAIAFYGGKFIIPYFGVTLRDRQRDYYYKKLDEHYPGLKETYQKSYGFNYSCNSRKARELYYLVKDECKKYGIVSDMKDIITYEKENALAQIQFPF